MPSGTTSGSRRVHSGGLSQRSRRSFNCFAARAIASACRRTAAGRPAGISAPSGSASVRWCAVSAGVRPAGKGKVSKQVVGV